MFIVLIIVSGMTYSMLKTDEPEIIKKDKISFIKVAPKQKLKFKSKHL